MLNKIIGLIEKRDGLSAWELIMLMDYQGMIERQEKLSSKQKEYIDSIWARIVSKEAA